MRKQQFIYYLKKIIIYFISQSGQGLFILLSHIKRAIKDFSLNWTISRCTMLHVNDTLNPCGNGIVKEPLREATSARIVAAYSLPLVRDAKLMLPWILNCGLSRYPVQHAGKLSLLEKEAVHHCNMQQSRSGTESRSDQMFAQT